MMPMAIETASISSPIANVIPSILSAAIVVRLEGTSDIVKSVVRILGRPYCRLTAL
jgi:hypothetical protein